MTQTRSGLMWPALCAVYLIWGSTYLGMAVMNETMPPLTAMGARFLAAGGVLALVVMASGRAALLKVSLRGLGSAALVATLLLGMGIGSASLATPYVPSGVIALVVASVTLWVVILRVVTGDRPSSITLAGVGVGMLGLAVLISATMDDPFAGGGTPRQRVIWSLVVVGATGCWALGSFLQPRLPIPSNPWVLTTYEMLTAGVLLTVVGQLRGEPVEALLTASARSWTAWVYMVVLGSLVAYSAFVWLLNNVALSLVTTYAYVNPVVAVLLGWWIKGEPITGGTVLGGAIILSGVVLVLRGERAHPVVVEESV